MSHSGLDIEALLESGLAEATAKNEQAARERKSREADRTRYSKDDDRERDRDARRSRHATSTPEHDDRNDSRRDDDKASANGSDRSSRRPYRENADHSRRSGGRDSGGYRDREAYRGGRYRSRSPRDDHYRPRGYDNSRDRPYRRERSNDRYENRDRRGGRDYPRNGGKIRSPEPTDDDNDRRTVFVQQLAARLRDKDLERFFSAAGPVATVSIVRDRISQRSKGIGYVQFKEEESVQKAIAMTGQKLLGVPIIAQLTEAEKNRQARANVGAPTPTNGVPFHRLYVGNIHFSVTEDDLKEVFTPFGELEFVQLQRDENARSRGYGFVQFVDGDDAKVALKEMNGFEIAGRPIRVGLGNDKAAVDANAAVMQRFSGEQKTAPEFQGSQFSGAGGRGTHNPSFDRAAAADKAIGGASALDDSDVGGVNFNTFSRDSLMRKLARMDDTTTDKNAGRSTAASKTAATPTSAPSRCVVIRNAFNEADETEPNWEKELEEDMRHECSKQYGDVAFVAVLRDSAEGEIYIKFKDLKGGDNALKGLNGRYFGGRTLTAQPVVDAIFNTTFPKAAKV